jgi:hypothetical protein
MVGNDSLWLHCIFVHISFRSVTKKAWDMEYKGDADKLFIQALHIMNTDRDRRVYDNFVPIIQSSGMGKSRMADEAAKYIFTLPFNLRPVGETSGTIPQSSFLIPSDRQFPRFPTWQCGGPWVFDRHRGEQVHQGSPGSVFDLFGFTIYHNWQ